MNEPNMNETQKTPQRASLLHIIRVISFGLFGLRNHSNYKEDLANITVRQAFLGGIIGVIIFTAFVSFLAILAVKTLS